MIFKEIDFVRNCNTVLSTPVSFIDQEFENGPESFYRHEFVVHLVGFGPWPQREVPGLSSTFDFHIAFEVSLI